MKRVSWFIFIIFIGLIPFFLKLVIFIFIISNNKVLSFLINEVDFAFLCLIISITNLKELKEVNLSAKTLGDTIVKEEMWIIISLIITFICIIISSGIIFISYLDNINISFNLLLLKIVSISLSIISIIYGFTIIDRVSNVENQILLSNRKQESI